MTAMNNSMMIIRFLNGFLNGCEFEFATKRLLVVSVSQTDLESDDPMVSIPEDTLMIPGDDHSVNFEILLPQEQEQERENEIILRELRDNNIEERTIVLNSFVRVGSQCFSIKKKGEAWDCKLFGQYTQPVKLTLRQRISSRKRFFFGTIVVLIFAIIAGSGGLHFYKSENRKIKTLNTILVNKNKNYEVRQGLDGFMYVIAQDHQQAIWVQQIIERENIFDPIRVVYPESEILRLECWLRENYMQVQFFKISFDSPKVPVLLFSRTRTQLSEKDFNRLHERLLSVIPYAERVDFYYASDNDAIKQATTELSALGVKYVKKNFSNYIGLTISGELTDSELIRLHSFINEYYKKWGRQYIKFNIDLKSNQLKDRSFSYGDISYAKSSSGEWSFEMEGE